MNSFGQRVQTIMLLAIGTSVSAFTTYTNKNRRLFEQQAAGIRANVQQLDVTRYARTSTLECLDAVLELVNATENQRTAYIKSSENNLQRSIQLIMAHKSELRAKQMDALDGYVLCSHELNCDAQFISEKMSIFDGWKDVNHHEVESMVAELAEMDERVMLDVKRVWVDNVPQEWQGSLLQDGTLQMSDYLSHAKQRAQKPVNVQNTNSQTSEESSGHQEQCEKLDEESKSSEAQK